MYAIIETGGKQIKVETGDVIFVEKLEVEAGETYTFDKVLLVGDETVSIGTPYVEGATVEATVEKQGKEKKASDACAVFPLGDAIRKGKLYQVRFKARGNQPSSNFSSCAKFFTTKTAPAASSSPISENPLSRPIHGRPTSFAPSTSYFLSPTMTARETSRVCSCSSAAAMTSLFFERVSSKKPPAIALK